MTPPLRLIRHCIRDFPLDSTNTKRIASFRRKPESRCFSFASQILPKKLLCTRLLGKLASQKWEKPGFTVAKRGRLQERCRFRSFSEVRLLKEREGQVLLFGHVASVEPETCRLLHTCGLFSLGTEIAQHTNDGKEQEFSAK